MDFNVKAITLVGIEQKDGAMLVCSQKISILS